MLISAIINSRDAVTHVHQGVTAEHFHIYGEEWSWVELYITEHRKAPPQSTFKAEFPTFPFRTVDDVAYFCQRVREDHTYHLMRIMTAESIDYMSQGNISQAINAVSLGMSSVNASLNGFTGSVPLPSDKMLAEWNRRAAASRQGHLPGIPSGFPSLDTATRGFHPGDYVVIGARLSHAKTWTLVSMARDAVLADKRALFVSLEMSEAQIGFRYHCLLSADIGPRPLNLSDLSMGSGGYPRFLRELESRVPSDRFHIYDKSHGQITTSGLSREIERVKPDIVFIDYLTLMDTRDKDWASVAKLSNEIQALAGRYQLPIVTAAQVNRLGEGKVPPSASQLSLSDSIGQDADLVITQVLLSPRVVKSRLAKHRNGASHLTWHLELNPSRGLYREITSDKALKIAEDDAAID
jgi:replicative DNA helicase